MKNFRDLKGFSLIELMTVLAVLSLLIAVAVPAYLGYRDRTRLSVFISAARSAVPELHAWAQLTGGVRPKFREADNNCDGVINDSDMTNGELRIAGVANTFAACRNSGFNEKSPWSTGTPLWSVDNTIPPGQITLIQEPSKITVIAKSMKGEIVFKDYIYY